MNRKDRKVSRLNAIAREHEFWGILACMEGWT